MTLIELQKVLGERIEIARSKELTDEQMDRENRQSAVIAEQAKWMVRNASVILRAEAISAQFGKHGMDDIVGK